MKYINKKTQVVLETACVISSDKWVVLKETEKQTREKTKKQLKEK